MMVSEPERCGSSDRSGSGPSNPVDTILSPTARDHQSRRTASRESGESVDTPSRQNPVGGGEARRVRNDLIITGHPAINSFLAETHTPVPSFPQTVSLDSLRALQTDSEINFLNRFRSGTPPTSTSSNLNHHPHHSSSELTTTAGPSLRFVNHLIREDQSMINLPYPDPDLSLIRPQDELRSINPQTPSRTISALPKRNNTPSGLRSAIKTTTIKPETRENKQQSSADNAPAPQMEIQAVPNDRLSNSPTRQTLLPSHTSHYPTPAAAIKSVIQNYENQTSALSTMDIVMAEMENRANSAPGIGKKMFGDEHSENVDEKLDEQGANRFSNLHDKQFAKYDSITNHYAAKRKNETSSTINGANPHKKVRLIEPVRLVEKKTQPLEKQQTEEDPIKKKEAVRRQLEIAKARRRTNSGTSAAETKKARVPSGFSSFGTRLLRSAVKTVKNAFTNPMTSASGAPPPAEVGFGVPAGLGVGPARSMTLPKPIAPPPPTRKIVPPRTTTVTQPRLPPAGPRRPVAAALAESARRRIISAPPPTQSMNRSTINRNRLTTTAPAIKPIDRSVSQNRSTWQPQTVAKPIINNGSRYLNSTRPKPSQVMSSKIPQLTRTGQTIIRASEKRDSKKPEGIIKKEETIKNKKDGELKKKIELKVIEGERKRVVSENHKKSSGINNSKVINKRRKSSLSVGIRHRNPIKVGGNGCIIKKPMRFR